MLLVIGSIILALLTVVPCGGVHGEPASSAEQPQQSVLRAAGRGKSPAGRSGAQARLLAKRAATVTAYRNLLKQFGEYSGGLEKGTGHISVDGYIKGAYVDEVRYYSDGSVKVVLGLDVKLKGGMQPASGVVEEAGLGGAYKVERPRTMISQEEWKSFSGGIR